MKVNNWGVTRTLISIYDETVYENVFVRSSKLSEWVYSAITKNKNKQTQPAFTCSKLTIETLKQGVKYVQS